MTHEQREACRKKRVIEYAEQIGNARKACRQGGRHVKTPKLRWRHAAR